jgi:hypothetical protein
MATQAATQGGAPAGGQSGPAAAPAPKGYIRKKIKWQTKARNGKSRRWKSRWILVKSRAPKKKA